MDLRLQAFERLLNIMDELREQCPWDKKQTVQTLRKLTIEETYELSEAVINEDWKSIKEELGDLFLHLVFYSKIGTEQQQFEIQDVLNTVCDKLIHRHPHIYADVKVNNEDDVKKNWELLKLKEGKKSILEGVPNGLPAINKSQRIQDKVRSIGFDWDNKEQVMEKVTEEIDELKEAIELKNQNEISIREISKNYSVESDIPSALLKNRKKYSDEIELEFGDVLFALINYSRFIEVDAESALEKTNLKFMKRFRWMENYANENKLNMHEMNLEQLDEIWNLAKKNLMCEITK